MKKLFITIGCLLLLITTMLFITPTTYASAAESTATSSGVTMQGGVDTPYNFGVVDFTKGFDLKFIGHLESIGNTATLNLVLTNVDDKNYSLKLAIWQNNASDSDVSTNLFITTNGETVDYSNTGWLSYYVDSTQYKYHVAYDTTQSLMLEKKNGSLSPIENGVTELSAFLAAAPSQRFFIGFSSTVSGLCFTVTDFNDRAFKSDLTLYSDLLNEYSTVYDLSFYPLKLEYSKLDSVMQNYYLSELRNEINSHKAEENYELGYSAGNSEGYSKGYSDGINAIQDNPDINEDVDSSEDVENEIEGFFVEYPIIAIILFVLILAFVIKLIIR